MVQIVSAVGVTAYVSLRSGEETVKGMVGELQWETADRVDAYVKSYTRLPHQFLRTTRASIEAEILDPQDFQVWERYLWHHAPLNESAQLIYFASPENDFIGLERPIADPKYQDLIPDPSPSPGNGSPLRASTPGILWKQNASTGYQLQRTKLRNPNRPGTLLETINGFRPTERPWFRQARWSEGPTWSPIYKDLLRPRLVISAIHPLYDATNSLMGVLAIDFNLGELSKFLSQLNLSDRGAAFIVERSGNLVASSNADQPVFLPDGDSQRRVNGFESDNQALQWSLIRLKQRYSSLENVPTAEGPQTLEIDLGRDHLFVYVNSLTNDQGLNWLLVVAEYESDFTQALQRNTRNTMLFAAIALFIATAISISIARLITHPILELNEASNSISSGAITQSQSVRSSSSIQELQSLAHSFNQMSARIKDSFAELEIRVQLRTFELWEAKESADRAKESATAANRSKSEFLANMSHELRTPLNGILGYAQILQKDSHLNPRQHQAVQTIGQCGNHLLSLINDVLDLAKIEAQRMDIDPNYFSLSQLLKSVVEMVNMRAIQRGLTFEAILDPNLPDGVISDPKRLRQVLINLLGNAVKFTDQGKVTLSVSVLSASPSPDKIPSHILDIPGVDPATAKRIRFAVQDTGIGMDQSTLVKVFMPFEQAGDVSQRSQGTGLGLAISQQIVELLGSHIHVTSRPGDGSKFWFDLTLVGSADVSLERESERWSDIRGYQEESVKILVADHRLENRIILTELLEPIGFFVQEASQLETVADLARDEPPDLIILDLDWPNTDDVYGILTQLAQAPEVGHIPMLVSSASVFDRDRAQSLAAGASDFLSKPIQADQLYRQISQHLQLHWVYDGAPAQATAPSTSPVSTDRTASPAPADGPLVPPPPDELEALFRLAMQGNISQIKHYANEMAAAAPHLAPFTGEINKLAQTFQVKKIRAFIEQYRQDQDRQDQDRQNQDHPEQDPPDPDLSDPDRPNFPPSPPNK